MKKKNIIISAICLSIAAMVSCQKLFPPPLNPNNDISNGVVPGLTQYQLAQHAVGDDEFSQIFTPEEGLGPIYNQPTCNNCHIGNGKGDLITSLTRFGKLTGSVFDSLIYEGGPGLHPHAIPGYLGGTIPSDANVISHRIAPVVMGLGFIAALTDSQILANAYPHNGVSGVPNYVYPSNFFVPQWYNNAPNSLGQYIGRFSRKAIKVSLQDQVVFALLQDLGGITCDYDQNELYNIQVGVNAGKQVQDPDVSAGFVNALVMYLRTLKVPPRRNTTDPDVIAGENLFTSVGCVNCHIPTFTTPQSDIAALSNQTFHPFSDFLLHDMGDGLNDGLPEGSAQGFEWRTAPLWGVGLSQHAQGGGLFLLHDGRATTFPDAISFHGGEAERIKNVFFALTPEQQGQVVKFLESL